MVNQLILALIFTVLPISELRLGMPLAIGYSISNGIPVVPIIILVILLNMLVIFPIFFFLDKFHEGLLDFKPYKRFYDAYLKRIQKKVDRIEAKYAASGFVALMGFVAVPLPTTGAWTGTIIAWLLGLERKMSIVAILAGVAIAGLLVALASLGFISAFF